MTRIGEHPTKELKELEEEQIKDINTNIIDFQIPGSIYSAAATSSSSPFFPEKHYSLINPSTGMYAFDSDLNLYMQHAKNVGLRYPLTK